MLNLFAVALRGAIAHNPRSAPQLYEAALLAVHSARFGKTVAAGEIRKPSLISKQIQTATEPTLPSCLRAQA